MLSLCIITLGVTALLAMPIEAADQIVNPDLQHRLTQALTHLDFLNQLSDNDMVYDFAKNGQYSWEPGSVCNANSATWPLLMRGNMAVAQLNLGPCAMLAPHLHPRATNIVVAVAGQTHTYMLQENGARLIQTILTPGKMTIFPKGSMHSMVNEGCGNNQLYSFLDSPDPGTLNIAQAFWQVGEDIGLQIMPMITLRDGDWNMTGEEIPPVGTGSQDGYATCRRRCGLDVDDGNRVVRMN